MSTKKNYIIIFLYFLSVYSVFGQCPDEAFCLPNNKLAFYAQGNNSNPSTWSFYFGPNHPSNGVYTSTNTFSGNMTLLEFKGIDCSIFNDGVIRFQLNNNCVYIDGIYCSNCDSNSFSYFSGCEGLYEHCGFDWKLFLDKYWAEIYCRYWEGDCKAANNLSRNGTISIGTMLPSSQKLTVKGGIISDVVKVSFCDMDGGWCDYVFEAGYDLKSLEEVDHHIKSKGHLHNTPSGAEIEAIGSFELKKVTLDHQEKIEEIFLHLIELKKEANSLEFELAKLKKENQRLKKE